MARLRLANLRSALARKGSCRSAPGHLVLGSIRQPLITLPDSNFRVGFSALVAELPDESEESSAPQPTTAAATATTRTNARRGGFISTTPLFRTSATAAYPEDLALTAEGEGFEPSSRP